MIDTLLAHRDRAHLLQVCKRLDLRPKEYGLLTLHRPSNVDVPEIFERLVGAIGTIADESPVVFPVHPRTRPIVLRSAAAAGLIKDGRLRLIDPLGYLEFVSLMESARLVLTDSGGIQEETTILGVQCLTLRENTERPVTETHGTNLVVGTQSESILAGWRQVRDQDVAPGHPPLWDGRAAGRIVDIVGKFADESGRSGRVWR